MSASQRACGLHGSGVAGNPFHGPCDSAGASAGVCPNQHWSEPRPLLSVGQGLCSGGNPILVGALSIQ